MSIQRADRTIRETPTLASVIDQAINNRLQNVHTCIPGRISAFDSTTLMATVSVSVVRKFWDKSVNPPVERAAPYPTLINVPTLQPHGGFFHLFMPIRQGDFCLVFFSERDFARVLYDGGNTAYNTQSERTHDLSDSLCMVGFYSDPRARDITGKPTATGADTDFCALRNTEGSVRILMDQGGNINIISPTTVHIETADSDFDVDNHVVVASTLVSIKAPSIKLEGAIEIIGNVTHTGNTVQTGTLTTGGLAVGSGSGTAIINGNLQVTGTAVADEFRADGIDYTTHVHSDPQGGTTGGPE